MNKVLFFVTVFSISINIFAMGEDKAGPNGGMIQMPGSFHTELILEKNQAKVYLLDMGFKKPTVAKSSVELNVTTEQDSKKVSCKAKVDYFICPLDVKNSEAIAQIQVLATRNGAKGKNVMYDFTKKESSETGAAHH